MQNICSLCLRLGPWVKDVELLPELRRSESQPNLAVKPFPNMSIGRCVCVCVMLSMMWAAELQLDLACLEQHRTGFKCRVRALRKTFKNIFRLEIISLKKSFWGVFFLQYHAIFMLCIMQTKKIVIAITKIILC